MLHRLVIGTNAVKSHQKEEPKNLEHAIFRFVELLKLRKRRNGTWFTFEHLNELKMVLERFSENHWLVIKALRISTASFKRLKAEWSSQIIRGMLLYNYISSPDSGYSFQKIGNLFLENYTPILRPKISYLLILSNSKF